MALEMRWELRADRHGSLSVGEGRRRGSRLGGARVGLGLGEREGCAWYGNAERGKGWVRRVVRFSWDVVIGANGWLQR